MFPVQLIFRYAIRQKDGTAVAEKRVFRFYEVDDAFQLEPLELNRAF
jgi:hypothetical protein